MSGFFFNLGRQIGRAAIPAIRKSKWIWDDLTGTEEQVLEAERALGATLAAELRQATERSGHPEISRRLNDLCQKLAAQLKNSRRAFHAEMFRADFPNGIALPGGFVFLSDSLVELCQSQPEELAFLLGHEMAHVVRGHARERLRNQTALRAASVVIARAGGPLGAWLNQKGLRLLQSAHSKMCEFEADELGLRLAARAGYDPAGAIRWLRRIENLGTEPGSAGPYFSSHPPPNERILQLRVICDRISSSPAEKDQDPS
jgi:beta-barrel assembly-enhancing protease